MKRFVITLRYTCSRTSATQRYFSELKRIPLISAQQERQWMKQYRNGSQAARNKLVQAHLRFVVSVAKKYDQPGVLLDDLISEGNLGLIRAIETFDEEQGFRLISYAVHRIRQRIQSYIERHTTSAPSYQDDMLSWHRYQQAWQTLSEQLQREPDVEELSEVLGVKPYYIHRFTQRHWECTSLEEPHPQYDHFTLGDQLSSTDSSPEALLLAEHNQTILRIWLGQLTEQQRYVITEYFGLQGELPRDVFSIAGSLGITHQRVSQIKEELLQRFRMQAKGGDTLLASLR